MRLADVRRGTPVAQQVFLILVRLLSYDLPALAVSPNGYTTGVHGQDSQHPLGTAMDFRVRTAGERAAAMTLRSRWLALGLGTAIDEGDHVHVQLFKAGRNTLG